MRAPQSQRAKVRKRREQRPASRLARACGSTPLDPRSLSRWHGTLLRSALISSSNRAYSGHTPPKPSAKQQGPSRASPRPARPAAALDSVKRN